MKEVTWLSPRSVRRPPCALAAQRRPPAWRTDLATVRINGMRSSARKAGPWVLVQGAGCLRALLSLAFCTTPCSNRIKRHPLVLFYDHFSPAFFLNLRFRFFNFFQKEASTQESIQCGEILQIFQGVAFSSPHEVADEVRMSPCVPTLDTVASWQITCPEEFSPLSC